MAYDPTTPPSLITQGFGGPSGLRWFALMWVDPIASVLAPGYISNAQDVGMRAGDGLIYKDTNRGEWDHYDLIVDSIAADGSATIKFPELPEEALPLTDIVGPPDGETYAVVFYGGRQVRIPIDQAAAAILTGDGLVNLPWLPVGGVTQTLRETLAPLITPTLFVTDYGRSLVSLIDAGDAKTRLELDDVVYDSPVSGGPSVRSGEVWFSPTKLLSGLDGLAVAPIASPGTATAADIAAKVNDIIKVIRGEIFDTSVLAILAAMPTQPPAWLADQVNRMVLRLKKEGIWDLQDVFVPLGLHTQAASLINWKAPGTYNPTPTNAPDFAAYRGFTGDGVSAYLATGFNPSSNAAAYPSTYTFRRLTAHSAAWAIGMGGEISIGSLGFSAQNILQPRYLDASFRYSLSRATGQDAIVTNAEYIGMFSATRSDANTAYGYIDAVQQSDTTSTATGALHNVEFRVMSRGGESTETAASYFAGEVGMYSLGGYLSQAQITAFKEITRDWFHALGVSEIN